MTSRRLLKAAEAFRSVVSMAILTEVRDPRVKHVTVIGVEVAPDMKSAKVHVSIMGDEKQQGLALRGLQNSAGFLQSVIAEKVDARYTPKLTFVMDKGVKHSLEVARILKEVLPSDETAEDISAEPPPVDAAEEGN
ncbi:30S ribosome-binding factor RbfA [Anatilimnocola floriformis]|uniref:30S ribosome-binding factor RbfA n=1 Tax=Anatilimnocola floriformis TaxID=2948575 RepID=UPI0020C42684|nr:30S ribosome-binding factor RbfA [Anatilimnocola floriformis]